MGVQHVITLGDKGSIYNSIKKISFAYQKLKL